MLDTWAGQCSFESPEYKTNKNDSQELDAPTPITQLYNVSNPDKSIWESANLIIPSDPVCR